MSKTIDVSALELMMKYDKGNIFCVGIGATDKGPTIYVYVHDVTHFTNKEIPDSYDNYPVLIKHVGKVEAARAGV